MTDLAELADQAFTDFGAALKGSGVEADQAWRQVLSHRQTLELGSQQTEATLTEIAELPPYVTRDERNYKTQLQLDIFDSVEKASTKGMQEGFTQLRAALELAARSDMTPSSDSAGRALLRQDIDNLVAGNKDAGVLTALTTLAMNPKYRNEVAEYGPGLLRAAGYGALADRLVPTIIAGTPGTTPKAQAARTALKALDKAVGHVAGISHSARKRVEATQPQQRPGFAGRHI